MISRRITAQGAAALALGSILGATTKTRATEHSKKTFVLVHGAWHGGWCWKMVREHLQAQGHRVFTPSLTGLGDRQHLRSPEINLDTHIADIANLMIWEDLENIILVGHSYGGVIISGVCDAHKDRVAHAIFLDAIVPNDGDTVLRGGTKEIAEKNFGPLEDGYLAHAREPISFGVPDHMIEELAWLRQNVTPQPLGTWLQPISLPNGGSDGVARTFIYCSEKPPLTQAQEARLQAFRDDPTWGYEDLPCGHDSMIILPTETTQMFDRISDEG